MKNRSLTEAALATPFHLACIAGPDRGAVIGLSDGVTIGRTGATVVDPTLSRSHCRFRASGNGRIIGELIDQGAKNPMRGFLPWARIRPRMPLRRGTRVRLGTSTWVVRQRPADLHWPSPPPLQRGVLGSRWFRLIPLLTIAILAFRFLPLDRRILVGVVAATMIVVASIIGTRHLRRAQRYDPAFLLLAALARREAVRNPPQSASAALTVDRDIRLWRRSVGGRSITIRADDRSIGVVGGAAAGYSRWIAAQIWMVRPHLRWITDPEDPGTGTEPCLLVRGPEAADFPLTAGSTQVCWAPTIDGIPPHASLILAPVGDLVGQGWMSGFSTTSAADPSAELPLTVELEDLVVTDLTAEATARRWSSFAERKNPWSVPVGVCRTTLSGSTEVFHLDLTEMGPHALLAGGTGSGKSGALQVWLRSLALHVPPPRLRMVLIDYKGGAGLAPLASLPHVELLGTDLDAGAVSWQLRHLRNVLLRRKQLLAAQGFTDISQWENTAPRSAPPRLLVVIDEFQAMADEHPELLGVITRLAAQGRSLGLHLLLSTQRPGPSVTADLRATIDLRVTLHCAETADSIAVRDDDLASRLPRHPGRALVGDTELQFALSGPTTLPAVDDGDAPLWPRPLPTSIASEELPPGTEDGTTIAVRENPLPGKAPLPLHWEGTPLLLAGPPSTREELARTARLLGSLTAAHLRLPAYVVGNRRDPSNPPGGLSGRLSQEYPWSRQLSTTNLPQTAFFLSRALGKGPMVVVIEDLGGLLREFDFHGAAMEAGAAWDRLVAGAAGAGIHLVVADSEGTARATRIHARLLRLPTGGVWTDPSLARVLPSYSQWAEGGLERMEAVSRLSGRFLAIGFSHGVPAEALGAGQGSVPLEPTMVQVPASATFTDTRPILVPPPEPWRTADSVTIVGNAGPTPIDLPFDVTGVVRWQEPSRWLMALQNEVRECVILLEPSLEAIRYLAARFPRDALWLKASYPCPPETGAMIAQGRLRPFGEGRQ